MMIEWRVCTNCRGAGRYNVRGNFPLFAAFRNVLCSGCNGRGTVPVEVKNGQSSSTTQPGEGSNRSRS